MDNKLASVRGYLTDLQDRICAALTEEDGEAVFDARVFEQRRGTARPRVLSDGAHIERAAVNYSHTGGAEMPAAATARHPNLHGASFKAASISLIVHPRNPYAPTTHANFRFFIAQPLEGEPVWWFGGGFDLTPYYLFEEDAVHWHQTAHDACEPFGVYSEFKKRCDEYFYLKHRREARGIGGLFFDDHTGEGFDDAFSLVRALGDSFLPAYRPILARRKDHPYGERERAFQLQRRGRYVEFNLLYDRGTRFGLELGGRPESILASLPPLVTWRYDETPEPGTPEARLSEQLQPRDWLANASGEAS